MKREAKLAHDLAGTLRVVLGRLKRRLQEQAQLGDLTTSQIAVLRVLDGEGAATVTRLAQALGMRPQSMGANIAALEAAGLVAGAPDPQDGRQTLWSLTPLCRARVSAGRAAREDWLFQSMQQNFSPEELNELARAVALLKRIADS